MGIDLVAAYVSEARATGDGSTEAIVQGPQSKVEKHGRLDLIYPSKYCVRRIIPTASLYTILTTMASSASDVEDGLSLPSTGNTRRIKPSELSPQKPGMKRMFCWSSPQEPVT